MDPTRWHTDIGRVREGLRGMTFLVKYGRREHIDSLVHSGSIRVSNALAYASERAPDRRDTETVRVWETANRYGSDQRVAVPPPSNPASDKRVMMRPVATNSVHGYPDHWMFSMSMSLSEDLLQRFNRSCCVIVGGIPYWRKFAIQVAREMDRKKFRAVYPDGTKSVSAHMPVTNVLMRDVAYHSAPEDPSDAEWMNHYTDTEDLGDLFRKDISYAHQRESKFVWAHFRWDDVATAYHRWEFRVEDDEGREHSLVEALEHRSHDSHMDVLYALRLPPVMVKTAPPLRAVKLTLD